MEMFAAIATVILWPMGCIGMALQGSTKWGVRVGVAAFFSCAFFGTIAAAFTIGERLK